MRKPPKADNVLLPGPAGALEALLEKPPSADVSGGAVVCHPHPEHGGTMQNKVAHTLARAFLSRGFVVLRFNFRGVGRSEGEFGEGIGETQDAIAAANWLRKECPAPTLWLAGFSFGAAIAIRAAVAAAADGLVSVAPAVSRLAGNSAEQPACPWLVVQGEIDELVDTAETIDWLNSLEPGPELLVMPDTGHFFHGRLVPLRKAVEAFVSEHQSTRA